ncbi:MAG: hypothetical protein CMB24_04720 [Euryarchaeota archaeon]|nr:hypothetical protein [Euryarchaeota archaeon]|tara:strand:- start:18 stop:635 length:618 start_codon:yes stop_codon:yes gene_type:complete
MDAPKGLIHFSNTPIGNELNDSSKNMKILLGVINLAFVVSAIYWPANLLLIAILLIVIDVILIRSLISASALVPLAVNLNHPFMESEPIAKSEIMVKFSEEWIDPGVHRLKLAKDSLSCWVIHRQDDDLTVLSIWDTNLKESVLNRHLGVINQAISLNNAVNGSNDEFEDARERESLESTLLEREWLPEEEIDVQGPISRIFSNE